MPKLLHANYSRRLILYQLLSFLIRFYYIVVNMAFWLINWPKCRKSVGWTNEERDNKLLRMSAKVAAEQIRRKQITSAQLVAACIARAQRVQPIVNAMVEENFDAAMAEAEAVDEYLSKLDEQSEEFKKLPSTKPLLGVPFTLKNNLDARGFVTVAGYRKFLKNPPAERDSVVVERLRRSGAILLALTNLPKLAMGADSNNDIYGRTRNPYDLHRIPGGSSGGEGAIIASGASIFGIGNDLGGSVRVPAAMCGVFGLKPTKDAVPLDGFVPPITSEIARAQWAIGPLCRYAEDLPLIFSTISGKPLSDMAISYDFTGICILYMEDLHIWFVERPHASVREAIRKTVRHFETTFNITAQKVDFPLAHHLYEIWGGAFGFGEPAKSPSWLAIQLVKLFLGRSEMSAIDWRLNVLKACVETRNVEDRNLMLHKLEKLRGQITDALGDNGILLLPTWPSPAPFHHQNPFAHFNQAYCKLANLLGFPALACPVGMEPQLRIPLSVQLVGAPNSEPLLMAAARELERAFGGWTEPGGV